MLPGEVSAPAAPPIPRLFQLNYITTLLHETQSNTYLLYLLGE